MQVSTEARRKRDGCCSNGMRTSCPSVTRRSHRITAHTTGARTDGGGAVAYATSAHCRALLPGDADLV